MTNVITREASVALLAIAAVAFAVIALTVLAPAPAAHAQTTFTVNSTADLPDADPGDGICSTSAPPVIAAQVGPAQSFEICTLRAAIMEANALSGADTITLPAGTYTLTIVGSDEDAGATGDLDITDDVTITGAGAAVTIIDAAGIDRVLEVRQGPTVQISDLTLTGGIGEAGGGGIVNRGTTTLTNVSVANNTATCGCGGRGGGIWNEGVLTLMASTVEGNSSNSVSGGIHSRDAGSSTTLIASTVRNNTALFTGGIDAFTLTMVGSTIRGNTAVGAIGGIRVSTLTMTESTVSGNFALGGSGGGIQMRTGSLTSTITNSTISGNTASASGGGIFFPSVTTVTILNTTITGNVSGPGAGGGLHADLAGPITIRNTIVADNSPADCGGTIASLGNNLDSDLTCNLIGANDLPGAVVLIGPLLDNGGPTRTHALFTGSPAINAGNDAAAPATDQRGLPRVGPPDIGAVEFQGPSLVDDDGDGFDSIASGGTDCDDSNPSVFPGAIDIPDDGIDQDCDGADAIGEELEPEPEPTPIGATVQAILLGGWNTLVWSGAAGADPAELARLIGPRVDSVWAFGEGLQAWEVHRPGGLDILNSLDLLAQGEAIFLRLSPGEPIAIDLPDVLPTQERDVVLVPAWNFVGYTGAAGPIADLLPEGVGVAFRCDRTAPVWDGFLPSGPDFVNAFTSVERLTALFVRNDSGGMLTIQWEQVVPN